MSRRRSLVSIARLSLIAGVASLLVGGVIVVVGFTKLLEGRHLLLDVVYPANLRVQELRTALLDQETGIRGFAITRDERLLEPYRRGSVEAESITSELIDGYHEIDGNDAVLAKVAVIDDAMQRWRTDVAAPILDAPVPEAELDATILRSKEAFDDVRRQVDGLATLVAADRVAFAAELETATTQVVIAMVAGMGLLATFGFWQAWLLRRQVVAPLERLMVDAEAVRSGERERPIEPSGPDEIVLLGERLEQMRSTIVTSAVDLERSNRDLEQFAYVASHDLQEPLRKVASFCQLLEQRYGDELDERGRTYVAFAVDGAKRMEALINDLLAFSRVGRTTDHFQLCDMQGIARHAASLLDDRLDAGRVDIGELPPVMGDPGLYASLFSNLLGNAVKYRRPDVALHVTIEAERVGTDATTREWRFSCQDNGIGIDERYREKVFVIFQRLHGRDEFDGTGIGLALCKKIVEFSGGRIWIDDPTDGVGTRVCWTLPIPPTEAVNDERP